LPSIVRSTSPKANRSQSICLSPGLKALAATPLLPRAPKSLLIPLIIAGLIIFNTMLSSIAERKKEIYIYTSLGLAPLHVGFLFLAEALTYGLMGSIFGYVVGQGTARLFASSMKTSVRNATRWVPGSEESRA